jgi:hypothetical protein
MFDLESALTEWRQQMLAAGIKTPAPLEELENHLREEIERRMKSGWSAQSAFVTAAQETGKANMLLIEFKKVSGTSIAMERMMLGICLAFIGLIVFLGGATVICCFSGVGDRVVAATAMASTMVVACGWKWAVPFLPVIPRTWKRLTVGIACMAFGFIAASLFCNFILPHFVVGEDRQIPAIGFWAAFLIAVFCCLGYGLCLDEKAREVLGLNQSEIKSSAAAES